jgi:hypothetical protein
MNFMHVAKSEAALFRNPFISSCERKGAWSQNALPPALLHLTASKTKLA